jgi:hypothetical protein
VLALPDWPAAALLALPLAVEPDDFLARLPEADLPDDLPEVDLPDDLAAGAFAAAVPVVAEPADLRAADEPLPALAVDLALEAGFVP